MESPTKSLRTGSSQPTTPEAVVIELGNISGDSGEEQRQPNVPSSPTKRPLPPPKCSKNKKGLHRRNRPAKKDSKRSSEIPPTSPAASKKNISALSHLKNTQQLLKDNQRSSKQPTITVNSQFRSGPRYSEYNKLGDVDECGPLCDCYYCALLNVSSESSDSDNEAHYASDEEIDSIALAYGFQSTKPSTCNCRPSREPLPYPLELGDTLHNFPPKPPHAKTCPQRAGIIKEMPAFIREFEEAMRQARDDESISDSIFDAVILVFGAIVTFFNLLFHKFIPSQPTKVAPSTAQVPPKLPK